MLDCPGTGSVLGGRWELGDVIGRGAMAAVHHGRDVDTGEPCAIKVLRADGEDDERRFAREAAVLRTLDHPAVVRLLDHGVADGCPYLVLEHVEGGSLDELLATGALAPVRVAQLGAQLAGGLAAAHRLGIVHRDVKPSNVLLERDGTARLADFGVAQVDGATVLTATGWSIGTPAYLAPERATGQRAGPSADVYSLGLVLVECLTGERVHTGSGLAALIDRLDASVAIPEGAPPRLRAVLAGMTALDPADRPSAADAAELLGIASTTPAPRNDDTVALPPADEVATRVTMLPVPLEPVPGVPVPVVAAATWSPRRRSTATMAAALVTAVLLAVGWGAYASDGPSAAPTSTTAPPAPVTPPPPTTAPPVTAPPETAPPEPEPEREREREGRGNGRGREGRDDD